MNITNLECAIKTQLRNELKDYVDKDLDVCFKVEGDIVVLYFKVRSTNETQRTKLFLSQFFENGHLIYNMGDILNEMTKSSSEE